MNKHWADFVAEKTASHGEFVLSINPVYSEIPSLFKENHQSAIDVVRDYVRCLLNVAADRVGFVKYQSAYFEALGSRGSGVLAAAISEAKRKGLGVILDAKRGDMGGAAKAYAQAYMTPISAGSYSDLEVDCLMVNPFLGAETLEPFVDCARKYGKGLLVLVKSSNPSSVWQQDRRVDGRRTSDRIAESVANWAEETTGSSGLGCVGAVIGATYPEDGQRLRAQMPSALFLGPTMGAHGFDINGIASLRRPDQSGVLVPMPRDIVKTDDLAITWHNYVALVRGRIIAAQDAMRSDKEWEEAVPPVAAARVA